MNIRYVSLFFLITAALSVQETSCQGLLRCILSRLPRITARVSEGHYPENFNPHMYEANDNQLANDPVNSWEIQRRSETPEKYFRKMARQALSSQDEALLGLAIEAISRKRDILNIPLDAFDSRAVHDAIFYKCPELLTMLLEHGVNPNIARDSDQKTAVHFAAEYGDERSLARLLAHPEIDVNVKDKWNNTPLYYARKNGHKRCVEMLLDKGAQETTVTAKIHRLIFGRQP